jgi:hypothetical protein
MRTEIPMILIALISVAFGMCQVFLKDKMWAIHEHSEWLMMGARVRRTERWDKLTELGGWAVIAVGVLMLLMIILSRF